MARRNAVRRKLLDDGQQQEAMKILKKYVLNKYRGSMIEIPGELPETTQMSEHLQRPQTLLLGSRDFERQSTTFSFLPHGYDAQQAMSPTFTSFDMLDEPKVLKEEIKYDAKKDTILTYPVRVIKAAMQIQFTKQLLCLSSIAIIGLIGGAVFQHLEQPNQIAEIFAEQNITIHRHRHFSLQILLELSRNDCFAKLNKSNSSQLSHQNSFCQHSMIQLLQRYDHIFRRDHGMTRPWDWDYWNSVFFAGTVFTTIGYGILAPKTTAGRIAFIIYALISIPLLLGVLNVFGRPFLESFQDKYCAARKKCSKLYRRFHPRLGGTSFSGSVDVESSPLTKNDEEDDEPQVPWQIAIIILVVFVVMCAWLFTLWEDWTFFESFYFTFSSLTTVGFGDLVPQHPRFALILFVFYICGLFVVSTVYAYIQTKIEDKYMWALQLVDQAGEETQPQRDDPSPVKLDGNGEMWGVPDFIRWRPDSMGGGTDSGALTRQSTVFMTNPEGAPVNCPPSVSAFMRSMSIKGSSLARSESVISKSSFGSKWRPFSNSPSSSEQLTPVENKKMWLGSDSPGQGSFHFGPKPSSSAPSLVPQRNLTAGGALSVITEVNDEDTLHARGSTQRSKVYEIFPIKQQSTEETDTGGESFEMIDDEAVSDGAMEDVVEIASTEDDQSQTSENDKVLELRSLVLTPTSSERSRRLQRVPAQDLETPTTETAPPFPPPAAPPQGEEKGEEDEE